MLRTFGQAGDTSKNSGGSWLDVILLPYTAMGVAVLLIFLLLLLGRFASREKGALDRIKPGSPDGFAESGRHEEDCDCPEVIGEREDPRPTD